MRLRFPLAILAGLAAAVSAAGQALDYVSLVQGTSGLLGYWRFDSTSQANSLVNSYTGSFVGNATLSAAGAGPALAIDSNNRALVLDGSGDYVTTNLVGGITTSGSMIAWVYLTAQPNSAGRIFEIAAMSQVAHDFDLQIEPNGGLNSTRFYSEAGANTTYDTALPLNTWTFLAATFTDSGARNIYLNGALVATSTAGTHGTSGNAFSIGESVVFTGRYFQGSIDEVAVFNRALTATEISNIYASASVIPEPATTAVMGGGLVLILVASVRRSRFPKSVRI